MRKFILWVLLCASLCGCSVGMAMSGKENPQPCVLWSTPGPRSAVSHIKPSGPRLRPTFSLPVLTICPQSGFPTPWPLCKARLMHCPRRCRRAPKPSRPLTPAWNTACKNSMPDVKASSSPPAASSANTAPPRCTSGVIRVATCSTWPWKTPSAITASSRRPRRLLRITSGSWISW